MGVCGQLHVPVALTPGKRPRAHFTGYWVGHSACLNFVKFVVLLLTIFMFF